MHQLVNQGRRGLRVYGSTDCNSTTQVPWVPKTGLRPITIFPFATLPWLPDPLWSPKVTCKPFCDFFLFFCLFLRLKKVHLYTSYIFTCAALSAVLGSRGRSYDCKISLQKCDEMHESLIHWQSDCNSKYIPEITVAGLQLSWSQPWYHQIGPNPDLCVISNRSPICALTAPHPHTGTVYVLDDLRSGHSSLFVLKGTFLHFWKQRSFVVTLTKS